MMDIVQVCVTMLDILTDMYEKDFLTKEEYAEHTTLKAAFLSNRLVCISDVRDRMRAMELIRTCRKINGTPVMEARH